MMTLHRQNLLDIQLKINAPQSSCFWILKTSKKYDILNLKFDEELQKIIENVSYYDSISQVKFNQFISEGQDYIDQKSPNQKKHSDLNKENEKKTSQIEQQNIQQIVQKEEQQKRGEQIQIKKGLTLSIIKSDKNQVGDIYQYQNIEQRNNDISYKKIIFIGERNAGKTTLLNAFVNYYFGITICDNVRVFSANQQPTTQISTYYLEPSQNRKYGINLIDTPGFYGDKDECTIKIVSDFMNQQNLSIDIIVLCLKATEQKLNLEVKQRLLSITKILGKQNKDYYNKIIVARTFYAGGAVNPSILTDYESPFYEIAQQLQNNWHLEFNGEAFATKISDQFQKHLFEKSLANFSKIEQKIQSQSQNIKFDQGDTEKYKGQPTNKSNQK